MSAQDANTAAASAGDELVAQAIAALTALARQTRVRGRGTRSEASEPVDFADLAAHVLTATAANLGGVETLLAGRPGSWEADLVRKLVEGTAGGYGDLLGWRTEPVRLYVNAYDALVDLGVAEVYEEDLDQALERMNADGLSDEQYTAAEARVEAIEQLWEQDQAAYAEAYRATAQRYLTDRGATCAVEIVAAPADPLGWDGLAELVDEHARRHTPLPMTGSAPDWSEGTPADALRRVGLTYTARTDAR